VPRGHEAIAAVVALAGEDEHAAAAALEQQLGHGPSHGPPGVFHQHQTGQPVLLNGPPIHLAHLLGCRQSHRHTSRALALALAVAVPNPQPPMPNPYPLISSRLSRILMIASAMSSMSCAVPSSVLWPIQKEPSVHTCSQTGQSTFV